MKKKLPFTTFFRSARAAFIGNYYDGDIEGSDCACEWARACKSCDMGLFFVRKSLICNQSILFVAIYEKPFQLASGSGSNVCG